VRAKDMIIYRSLIPFAFSVLVDSSPHRFPLHAL
jgi:hypothetical protein